MRGLLLLPLLAFGLRAAEVQKLTVTTADGPRVFFVATPKTVKKGSPLVLLFHGHMGSAKHALGEPSPLSAWLPIADREGIVVAALDGAKGADGQQGWNDGRPGATGNPATDDVGFTKAVVLRLQKELGTDPTRTYAMGMSNGGVFTFRLAMELDPPLAALAAACATMPGDHAPLQTTHPLSVLLIEGTEDPLMPYGGGQVHYKEKLRGAVLGTETTLAFWRTTAGLSGRGSSQDLPHRDPADPTRVERQTWGLAAGPQVMLLRVRGGGHCEPTLGKHYGWLYRKVCGPQNGDVESAEEAWAFFRDKRSR
jgi:polyhydroxybutyrate depolymerase